ncbi:MAG: hypothetical protein DRO05_03770 [Thermoproteota archaeon]|nr:MAG: hypothetical protein DRO05_03770 [Candidatus Korarchaeota archaeon]
MKGSKRNVIIMTLSWAIMTPFTRASSIYFSLYARSLGATNLQVGIISSLSSLVLGISRLLGGYLCDVMGRKRLIVQMTFTLAVTRLLFYFAKDWTMLLLARVIASIALLYQPAIWALMADSLPEGERGRYMAISNTISGIFGMLGPAAAAFIVKLKGVESGVRFLYLLSAISLALGALTRFFLVETIPVRGKPSLRGMLRDYAAVLSLLRGDIGKVALISAMGMAFTGLIDPFVQIYAVENLKIDPAFWGFANMIASVVTLLSQPLSGYLADKFGSREVVSLSFLSTSIGYLILLSSPTGGKNFVVASLLALSIMPRFPAMFALRADVTVPEVRGRVDALTRLMANLMLSASNVAGGKLYETSPRSTIVVSALLMGSMAIISLTLLPKKPKDRRGKQDE